MKYWKTAILATTILAAAQPVMAQSTSTAITGPLNNSGHQPGWSSISRAGASCNSGSPVDLTGAYINLPIGGRHGAQAGNQPMVARNFGGAPFSFNGITVGVGGVILHPANNGDCAILRFTVPATGRGLYTINAAFSSADGNSMNGAGDGTNAMVLVNGNRIGNIIDTRRGPGNVSQAQVRLCPGDTVDFAVHMKAEMSFDTTNVSGDLQRTGDVSPTQCVSVGTAVGNTGGPDPRNNDVWEMGDPITMTGTPNSPRSNCCAPWGGIDINPALTPVFPNGAGGSYTRVFDQTLPVNAALNAQMSAYLNYLNALNPAVTTLTMTWQAANLGTGPAAATSGTTIGAAQTIVWNWTPGGATMSMPGGPFWSGAPFPLTSWIGFQTTISVNGGQTGAALLGPDCRSAWSAWRAQPQQILQPGSSGTMVFETIGARGQIIRSRPVQVTPGARIQANQLPRN